MDMIHLRKIFLTIKNGAIKFFRKPSGMCHRKSVFRILGNLIHWVVGVIGTVFVSYLILYLLPGPKVITDFHKDVAFEKCHIYAFNAIIPDNKILDQLSMTIQFPGRVEDHALTSTYYDVPSARLGEGILSGENDAGCFFIAHPSQPPNVQFSLDSLSIKASVNATSLQGMLRTYYLVSNQPLKELPSSEFVVSGYYEYRIAGIPIRKNLIFKY